MVRRQFGLDQDIPDDFTLILDTTTLVRPILRPVPLSFGVRFLQLSLSQVPREWAFVLPKCMVIGRQLQLHLAKSCWVAVSSLSFPLKVCMPLFPRTRKCCFPSSPWLPMLGSRASLLYLNGRRRSSDVHAIYTIKYHKICIVSLIFILFCD